MTARSPTRKTLTIFGALAVAGVFLWIGGQVVVMSGTKASFSFVNVKSPPAGGMSGGGTSGTTRTTTGTPPTTTATATGDR